MEDDAHEFLRDASVLHPHQVSAVQWLAQNQGGILADEMGLGKTLSVLSFASWCKMKEKKLFRVLVVAPLSVAPNWISECERFTRLSSSLLLGNANDREKVERAYKSFPTDLLVTSYEFAREEWLQEIPWALIVVDEAQKLKNQESVLYKTLKLFSGSRVLLTVRKREKKRV
jgi:SNF2 family DNA or RNA helicase